MHLKIATITTLLLTTTLLAAEPAIVTTYEESHPHPEFKLTYAADKDTHTADADKVVIRKGVCVWLKSVPESKEGQQEARLENGTLHTINVAEFYKVSAGPPPAAPTAGEAKPAGGE